MDGEFQLKCNLLACRKPVAAARRAVVTTCSHLFCEECATRSFSTALVCPACETSLTDQDDIAFTNLSPPENYKSSVLSGLPPSMVHDIAGRALSFWVYQVTQEFCFNELIQKQLESDLKEVDGKLKGVVMQANQEMGALREKVSGLEQEKELEKRRVHDLTEQCAEKSRQLQKMQQVYDRLKRKTLLQHTGNTRLQGQNVPPQYTVLESTANMSYHGQQQQQQQHHHHHISGLNTSVSPRIPLARQQFNQSHQSTNYAREHSSPQCNVFHGQSFIPTPNSAKGVSASEGLDANSPIKSRSDVFSSVISSATRPGTPMLSVNEKSGRFNFNVPRPSFHYKPNQVTLR